MFKRLFSNTTNFLVRPVCMLLPGLDAYGSSDEDEVIHQPPPPKKSRKRPSWADKAGWTKILIREFNGSPSEMVRDGRFSHLSRQRLGEYKKVGLERLEELANKKNAHGKFLKNIPSDKQSDHELFTTEIKILIKVAHIMQIWRKNFMRSSRRERRTVAPGTIIGSGHMLFL